MAVSRSTISPATRNQLYGGRLKKVLVSVAACSAIFLTGCGASDEPAAEPAPTVSVAPASPSPSPTPTPSPSPTRKTNERGELVKEIGEVAGMGNPDGKEMTLNFKVTSIKPIECDAPYATPPNGIPLAVSLEIETSADFEGPWIRNEAESGIDFSPHYWRGYADNGTRMNTVDTPMVQNCLADPTQILPNWVGPGEKLNGMIILDVTTPTGEVAFEPADGVNWVWKYPSA